MQSKVKKFYLPILLLFLISLLPVVVGTLLYQYHEHLSLKTLNHGTLINPPISLSLFGNVQPSTQKQWKIVYQPTACCDAACEKLTFTLHQLRLVLGKDHNRVNLILALNVTCPVNDPHDFQILSMGQKENERVQQALRQQGNPDFTTGNKIYLVDPLDNVFMLYASSVDPMNILKDLKRVLEVSQIG